METTTKLFHFSACARTSLQKVECEVNCIRIHVCIVCVSPITEREIMQRFLHHEFFPLINLPTWSVVVIHCNRITTSCFRLPIDKQTTNCSTLANRITIKRNVTFFFSITIKRHVAINHQYRRKAIALSSSLIAKSFRYKSKFTFVSTKISSSEREKNIPGQNRKTIKIRVSEYENVGTRRTRDVYRRLAVEISLLAEERSPPTVLSSTVTCRG